MNGMFKKSFTYLLDANAGGGGNDGNAGNDTNAATGSEGSANTTLTFETWHADLPVEQKALIESHTKSLKSALGSERESRKDLEKQLREMAKNAEKGSDAQAQLTKLADDLQASDRKADFFELAHGAGVKNLKLAYTVAVSEDMFDKHGRVDFDEMKKSYPELFGSGSNFTQGNAGSGTNSNTAGKETMDDFIRQKIK
jgi:hypothetical protein